MKVKKFQQPAIDADFTFSLYLRAKAIREDGLLVGVEVYFPSVEGMEVEGISKVRFTLDSLHEVKMQGLVMSDPD